MKKIFLQEQNLNIPQVQIRKGFSDRNNIETLNTIIQTSDFDERTRTCLLNEIKLFFKIIQKNYNQHDYKNGNKFTNFINCLLRDVYAQEVNYNIEEYNESWIVETFLKPTILYDKYNKVLDVIEFIANDLTIRYLQEYEKNDIYEHFNKTFKEEYIGYRFVNGEIIPITNEIEIKEIEQAIQHSEYQIVKKHLDKAIKIFANREKPDYDNVIKESITAVEAMCQIITNNEKSTLGEALKHLKENNVIIPSALKEAFSKLYGYTSDTNGIRHANGIGEKNSTIEEAQFMLITCSAFINYLIAQYSKIKH